MNKIDNEDKEEKQFDSMKEFTNFILFNEDATESIFNLSPRDSKQINYFANELDAICDDLAQLNIQIKNYKTNYRLYCENLLKLCDEKDSLTEM